MRNIINNKRGLAEIITVILIILLSLAAIAILWNVIKPLITDSANKVSTSCLTGAELEIKDADCSGAIYTVKLERGNVEDEIKSIKFVFADATNDNSKTIELSRANGDNMPSGLDVITYSFNKTVVGFNATKVKIAPTMKGETDDLSCSVVDESVC